MCTLCALIFYIRTQTHTHIQTVCVFARISIVCTLCDIFMRPNFVASNLRCVWVTTAVAISLPHLWQIFSLWCCCCCCCCFASQTTCVVKSTLAFISHQATTHNRMEPPIKQPRNPKSISHGEQCESKGAFIAIHRIQCIQCIQHIRHAVLSFHSFSPYSFCCVTFKMQLNNTYGK